MPGVEDVDVTIRHGAERSSVVAWEQRHNVTLPSMLKQLYSATDGFSLTWNYSTSGKSHIYVYKTKYFYEIPNVKRFHRIFQLILKTT